MLGAFLALIFALCIRRNLEARFGGFVNHPVFTSIANSLEHRNWPIHDNAHLDEHGIEEIRFLAEHFSYLEPMSSFDLEEALFEWKRLKFETRQSPFFSMGFTQFYEHLSQHFDSALGYPNVLILARICLVLVVETSCCERVYSGVNRIQTKARASLKLETVSDVLLTQELGPAVKSFDPLPIYTAWLEAPFIEGKGEARGRQLAAMVRAIKNSETSHGDGDSNTSVLGSVLNERSGSGSRSSSGGGGSSIGSGEIEKRTTPPGGVGLINLTGNLCFLSSIIQCLASVNMFCDELNTNYGIASVSGTDFLGKPYTLNEVKYFLCSDPFLFPSCHTFPGASLVRATANSLMRVTDTTAKSPFAARELFDELRKLAPG